MVRKLIIALTCLSIIFAPVYAQDDDATPTPEATLEVIPVAEPVPVIVETPDTTPGLTPDLVLVVTLVAMVIVTVAQMITTQRMFNPLTSLVTQVVSDRNLESRLTSEAAKQLALLTPEQRNLVAGLVSGFKGVTDVIPGALDNQVADWIKRIHDTAVNKPQAKG